MSALVIRVDFTMLDLCPLSGVSSDTLVCC
jgi:hypothetical protein